MLSLNFSSAIAGTVVDKDGEGTGFTSVQPNKFNSQYDPSRINLDPAASTLTLTATKGSNANTTNNLKNALQVAIDSTKTFTISTRIKNPFTSLTTAYQQAGIFLGSNQDNYAKAVGINVSQGTGGMRLQFYREENAAGSNVGEIANIDWANVKTLDLFLTGDPGTNTITAAYRINSDTAAPTTFSQKFNPSQAGSFFGSATSSRAGILAFTKDAADTPVTFDSFGIAQDVKVNFQPASATLPTGYIKDSGDAYSATRGYGWVNSSTSAPFSVATYTRDRNRAGVDQRIDTLAHMQFPNTTAAAWEYALPNGRYNVTVSVGDAPNGSGVYDSSHTINVEGVNAINSFKSTAKQEYQLATVNVNVTDGKLTINANGGSNTKINYLEIANVTPGSHPSVTGSAIASDATGVYRDAAVTVDVALTTVGAGVSQSTLNTSNIQLYRTRDNALVSGSIGTSGGGDAIVYQPSVLLDANTNYTFRISNQVRDQSGATFLPYSRTFNTGANTQNASSGVNFIKSSVYEGVPISTVLVSPQGKLYAAGLDGSLRRWTINGDGSLSGEQVFNDKNKKLTGRAIIGLAFNPNDTNEVYLWTSNNNSLATQPADDFTGKISKLTLQGTNFDGTVEDYVVGLPRSAKDHLSNSLVFGPDGQLYMTQGSNSAMGAPDSAWYNRPERLLTATVLKINPNLTPPTGGFNVQTETYTNSAGVTTTGNYNPYATNAPVKIFATGIRNAYDLAWHSNGNLYVPGNGSAAGGNTPDDPSTTVNEGLTNVGTQNDYLFKVVQGGYYGHPNPKRQEYVMNGGNPTSGVDPVEVGQYPVGIKPDSNYRGIAHDFGRNRSPNGVIEYKSSAFNGALKGKLLVVEYSGGDDILALAPGSDGNIPNGNVSQVISGLTDPLDLTEDTKKNLGNLYVAELMGGGVSGRISLLKAS